METLQKYNIVKFPNSMNDTENLAKNRVNRYEGGDDMDDLLQKYIEKVDRDQSDLRNDIRESEKRIYKSIDDSEQRMDKRLDKIEQMISDQNAKIEKIISGQNSKIDILAEKVTEKLEDDKKYRHTNNITIALGTIATVIAMIGIYYATVSMITDILGLMPK